MYIIIQGITFIKRILFCGCDISTIELFLGERYVDLSTCDINETRQQNHVIPNNQYKQQQEETMRNRDKERQ
jgi:hypothetical protein